MSIHFFDALVDDAVPPRLRLLDDGVEGAIVGTALYEGRFTIAEGQKALQPDADEQQRRPYRPVPATE